MNNAITSPYYATFVSYNNQIYFTHLKASGLRLLIRWARSELPPVYFLLPSRYT